MTGLTKKKRSFILLEVLVSIIILAVVMTALFRGFLLSMNTIRKIEINLEAMQLAETLLEDYELEPPVRGVVSGRFEDDIRFGGAYASYSWKREVDEIDPDYDDIPRQLLREPEPVYRMKLQIWYEYPDGREYLPIEIDTYLMNTELFSYEAMTSSQLF